MKHLYQVHFVGQTLSKNHNQFKLNAGNLNGKTGDYKGIERYCVICHHMDEKTVQLLLTNGFKGETDSVEIVEITDKTLQDQNSSHILYLDLISNYYLPHNTFKNITKENIANL